VATHRALTAVCALSHNTRHIVGACTQDIFDKACRFIVTRHESFDIVEDKDFRDFVGACGYVLSLIAGW